MKEIYEQVRSYVKITGQRIQETHPLLQGIAFFSVVLVLSLSFLSVVTRPSLKRTVFFFPAGERGTIKTEIRYLPVNKETSERLILFLDELLLGPIYPGVVPLYPTSVRPKRAFIRGSEAYIDVTGNAEDYLEIGVLPKVAFEIFKKNVCTNFRNVAKIHLYIDGREVYGSTTDADAESSDKKR